MLANIILTLIFWAFYFFLHSFLISNNVKKWVISKTELSNRKFRLVYSIISTVGLLPVLYFLATTKSPFLLAESDVINFCSMAFSVWGVIVVKLAFKNYNLREFLGMKSSDSVEKLQVDGLNKYVRHPLYSGTILISLGFWLFIPNTLNLVSILCVFVYLIVGIRLEENKLFEEFGEEYLKYKSKVPSVIPDVVGLLRKNI